MASEADLHGFLALKRLACIVLGVGGSVISGYRWHMAIGARETQRLVIASLVHLQGAFVVPPVYISANRFVKIGHTYMEEQGLHLFSRHRGVFRKRFFVGFQHAICVCSILVQVHSSLVFRHRDIRAREDHMALAAHGIFLGNVSSKIADEIVFVDGIGVYSRL